MFKMRSPPSSVLLLCWLCGGMSAWAAPTTTQQLDAGTEVAPATVARDRAPHKAGSVDPAAVSDVPNPSNTIKMLLELQAAPGPSASAGDSGRPAPRPGGSRPNTQTQAANPFGKGDSPFGASPEFVRPDAAPGTLRGSVGSQAASTAGNFTGVYGGATGAISVTRDPNLFPAQQPGGSSSGDSAEPSWWMPSEWFRWIREHRQEVLIGAAVAVALAWASASRGSQRRR